MMDANFLSSHEVSSARGTVRANVMRSNNENRMRTNREKRQSERLKEENVRLNNQTNTQISQRILRQIKRVLCGFSCRDTGSVP